MSSSSWKRMERDVADFFGSTRTPLSGSNSKHDTESDTLHKRLYVEAKRDKKFFGKTFSSLLHSVEKKAKKEKKVPVICLKEHGRQGFYLIVHSKYLIRVAKEATDAEKKSR